VSDDRPYSVLVREPTSGDAMQQRTVRLAYDGRGFVPDQTEVVIDAGDLVLWNCTQAPVGCEIVGDKGFFRSSALTNECGYSHAFGMPGDYEWGDAHGHAHGHEIHGVVHVLTPDRRNDEDLRSWRERLATPTLVTIIDAEVDTPEVTVEVGQTVFFAVVRGPGLSITDQRILDVGRDVHVG
jgi:hypothetical protein